MNINKQTHRRDTGHHNDKERCQLLFVLQHLFPWWWSYLRLGSRYSEFHHLQNHVETLLVVEQPRVLHKPQAKAAEGRHDGAVEVLGVGGGGAVTLLHDELTDPLDRTLTHQQIRGADREFGQTRQDLHGSQGTVQFSLPLGEQAMTDEGDCLPKQTVGWICQQK